jgi:cyanophycin synthetase
MLVQKIESRCFMEFRQIVAYHGPNRWAGVPTLEVLVDWQSHKTWRSSEAPQVIARLLTWLPALNDPPQGTSDSSPTESFAKLAQRGLSLAEVLERVTCVIESAAGTPPRYSGCHATDDPAIFHLTFEFEEESLGRACLETARTCVLAALNDTEFDAAVEIRKLVDLADDVRLGPSTRAILRAAAMRDVPCRRLTTGSLVQLGEGARQHRIWTAETDQTSSIGESIAQDKELTKMLLRNVGVPVPQGRIAQSAAEAWNVACEIGLPVVLKPRDANHGRGVSFDLMTCEQVTEAFDLALRENKSGTDEVIVEHFARGHAHRLLVVNNRLVAATRGESDIVIGNGRDSIAQLIDAANQDPLRGENYTDLLTPMELDDVTLLELKQQDLTPASIPAEGQEVIVRHNGDLTTDETADVHPAIAERAVLAAQTVGLNIAGIDLIAADIGRPLEEQGGAIIEVNAGPSLLMHVEPIHGQPQPVGDAIVELMFPAGENGRIPIIGIANTRSTAEVGCLIADLLRKFGRRVGIAVNESVQIDGQQPFSLRGSEHDRVNALLLHPRVEAAIFECRSDEALTSGLGCERCDVSVLPTSVFAGDHPNTAERLLGLLPLVHAVPPKGTLVASSDTPHLETLLAECRGQALLYSVTGETDSLRHHQAQGGRVAFLLHNSVVLGVGPSAYFLPLKPLDSSGSVDREHWLLAIATTWAAGVSAERLRDLLKRSA